MKFITREVKIYTHIFANIDLSTGQAINMISIEKPYPMKSRELMKYQKDNNNAVLIGVNEETIKCSLPVELFVQACKDYALKGQSDEETPIVEGDIYNDTDSVND